MVLDGGLAAALSLTLSLKGEGTVGQKLELWSQPAIVEIAGERHSLRRHGQAPSPFRERAGERERSRANAAIPPAKPQKTKAAQRAASITHHPTQTSRSPTCSTFMVLVPPWVV